MVNFVKRDRNDILGRPILGFMFKNRKFLMVLRVAVALIFFYAIFYGFLYPTKENIFTNAVFWGVFWSFFMLITLPTFGRIFCGICPHGFLGKYITKLGLKRTMPTWLQNRYIGITLLVLGWWFVTYTFDAFWRSPFNTAAMFAGMTLVAFVLYYLYKDMSYCKYICPIGTLTRAYDKISCTKLETYTSECKECKTFECASACPYDLKPFTFAKKNQTDDCTLCMECASACEAVKFKVTKPAEQLNSKLKILNAEVWTYILILACIPISMGFAHGLNRSNIANELIWNKTATFLNMSEFAGGFAFVYALVLTLFFAFFGFYLSSKVLKKDFKMIFTTLGVALIPLFIMASLGHTLESFFIRTYPNIIEGFAQAFGFSIHVDALAKRGDGWLSYFGLFKWIGIVWAFILLYKRIKLIEASKVRKFLGYIFASLVIFFYLGVNIYTGYVFAKYGAKMSGHAHGKSGTAEMFQTVPKEKVILLQTGKDKASGAACGMNLPMVFKTNHSAVSDGKVRQYCSLHCLVDDYKVKNLPLSDIKVVDVTSLTFIDAKDAFYVVGSSKKGTMSMKSKYAFASKKEAFIFSKKYGGEIVNFEQAIQAALEDFNAPQQQKNKTVKTDEKEPFYFSFSNPALKEKRSMGHMMGGGKPSKEIPTKEVWLVYGDLSDNQIYKSNKIENFYFDLNQKENPLKENTKMGQISYRFEVPNNGYYNLFAIDIQKKDATTFYKVAKLEYLHGSHGSEDIYNESIKKELVEDKSIIDLIRIKSEEEESFFYRHSMGSKIEFKALFEGKPLANAKIKVELQSGWMKELKTDEKGRVSFEIIRDYFPNWSEFNKRFKQELLLTLHYENENTQYILTYPASFYPNSSDYKSYGYALLIILITLILSTVVVYRFRKNRVIPFKEVSHA